MTDFPLFPIPTTLCPACGFIGPDIAFEEQQLSDDEEPTGIFTCPNCAAHLVVEDEP